MAIAVSKLPVRSCLIDGEEIVCDENGLAVLELIRRHEAGEHAVLSGSICLSLTGRICGASQSRRAKLLTRSFERRKVRIVGSHAVRAAVFTRSPTDKPSAALQAAQLPCAEQFLGFVEGQALMSYRPRDIDRTRQGEPITALFDYEQKLVGEREQMLLALVVVGLLRHLRSEKKPRSNPGP